MSRVLVYTSPARGHLYPIVPIAEELARRGHEIALRSLSSQIELVRELGFDSESIGERIERIEHDDFRARSKPAKVKRALSVFVARAEHEVPDMLAAIEAEHPDLLLVDCMAWGALAVAQAWGGPWAQYVPYPIPLPSADAPPFGPGLSPARGPLGRLRDRAVRPFVAGSVERGVLGPLNAIRARVGVGSLGSVSDMFTLAPLLLYLTAEPFEYPRRDWPACVRMVGPCCWDPPAAAPEWLAGIERALLLVSASSERQNDTRLVTTALEAFADEKVQLVATVPADGIAGIEVPANARLERFLPHTPLLARTACAITHGGAGVTQKALAAGVPVCAVPFGRDQHEVARRVETADAGTRLPAARLTPERLRAKVHEAITKRPGAQRVADGFSAAGGPVIAADALEALIGARATPSENPPPWPPYRLSR
ncbi:MAG: glycosyltransferase [Solirubrobacteraceae bacterium]